MNYVKLAIAAAVLFAVYMFGHSVATNKGDAAMGKAKAEFAEERTAWAHERTEINAKALAALSDAKAKADQKEQELRAGFSKAEKQYQLRIKELENARNQADTRIADTGPDGGLWAPVEGTTCRPTGDSGNTANVSQATGSTGRLAGTLQCRLTTQVAQALVQITSDADKKTELLNKCIDSLAVPSTVLNPLPTDPVPSLQLQTN
jgi:hypothetical protein